MTLAYRKANVKRDCKSRAAPTISRGETASLRVLIARHSYTGYWLTAPLARLFVTSSVRGSHPCMHIRFSPVRDTKYEDARR